jgi:hypothetical protein
MMEYFELSGLSSRIDDAILYRLFPLGLSLGLLMPRVLAIRARATKQANSTKLLLLTTSYATFFYSEQLPKYTQEFIDNKLKSGLVCHVGG